MGWGTYSGDRGHQHVFQAQTNYLLGFYDAALRYKFGKHRFEQKVYLACRVGWAWLAQTAEYLLSMLCQSYWYDGGLNPALAGTMKVYGAAKGNITHESHRESFKINAEFLVNTGIMKKNIDDHRQREKTMSEAIKWWDANPHNQVWHALQQRQLDLKNLLQRLLDDVNDLYIESTLLDGEDLVNELDMPETKP